MTRKSIGDSTVTSVLIKSRRRCCICFGLERDTNLKAGQIAHLDQNSSNNAEDNLAFLCLVHHDEYDSQTRQRKGLTLGEVKAFRAELYERLSEFVKVSVHFGQVSLPPQDPYAGVWIRMGGSNASAEIALTPIGDSLEGSLRYAVTGLALWGTDREFGPNIGDFAWVGDLHDGRIEYSEQQGSDELYSITLMFKGDQLDVEESNWLGRYGMNVVFDGSYRRAR